MFYLLCCSAISHSCFRGVKRVEGGKVVVELYGVREGLMSPIIMVNCPPDGLGSHVFRNYLPPPQQKYEKSIVADLYLGYIKTSLKQ